MAFSIEEASSASDVDEMRALFAEYQRWLGLDLTFQGFSSELRSLPGPYAPPDGRMLLARDADGGCAGGVAMKPLATGICEMKRLYVRPRWRGLGLGRLLADEIIRVGRRAGYARMRLDTLAHLAAATKLYRSMGFHDIAPYYDNPLDDAVYMEKSLDPGET